MAIRRKRARSGEYSVWAAIEGATSNSDPWSGIPAHLRKTETQVLSNGAVLTTYVDTLEDLSKPEAPTASKPLAEPYVPEANTEKAPKAKRKRKDQSRFATYRMPGH